MPLSCKERTVTEKKHLSNHSERGPKQQSSEMQEASVALAQFGTFGFRLGAEQCVAVLARSWVPTLLLPPASHREVHPS